MFVFVIGFRVVHARMIWCAVRRRQIVKALRRNSAASIDLAVILVKYILIFVVELNYWVFVCLRIRIVMVVIVVSDANFQVSNYRIEWVWIHFNTTFVFVFCSWLCWTDMLDSNQLFESSQRLGNKSMHQVYSIFLSFLLYFKSI